jgi:hypothetical protein
MANRTAIMQRAWELFRATYRYPAIPFRSIGRACFASSLRRAWAEAREAGRVAAIPATVKAERVAELRDAIAGLTYCDDFQRAAHARKQMKKEIASLAA